MSNKDTTEKKIEVMIAYVRGETVQARHRDLGDIAFSDLGDTAPSWNWDEIEYRIKPKAEYRPYKGWEEMKSDFAKRVGCSPEVQDPLLIPIIWVKEISGNHYIRLINGFDGGGFVIVAGGKWITFSVLLRDYTYLDGSPCGIEEANE